MQSVQSLKEQAQHWLSGNPEDAVLRWLYRTLVVATIAVVALDYSDLDNVVAEKTAALPSVEQPSATPLPQRDGARRRPAPLRETSAKMREPMTFDLAADGRLIATGTITPGISKAFADEVAKRGSYIKTVVLQSPGGSVQDALAMGRLIREKKFATEVEDGRYCASSCPLVFAGGVERKAGKGAAIGVHQVSAAGPLSRDDGMENAQQISAVCQKYLRDMGIDLGVWVHAMETPRDELYYFKADELLNLKLATQANDPAPASKRKT
ncbi:MAG: hypothetical protein JOZ70_11460 [Pseudolabrys sp.]|nr:hypothetical protein [Pseudolabrys sp.]